MSVLPPEVHSALSLLLQGLQSPDNNVRAHAEEQLANEWIVARADILLMGLVEQIQAASGAGVPTSAVFSSPQLINLTLVTIVRRGSLSPGGHEDS